MSENRENRENREALVVARNVKGLSQEDLANLVGCTQQYISLIESGARNPSPQMAKRIADAVGRPIGSLFPDIIDAFRALLNNGSLSDVCESN